MKKFYEQPEMELITFRVLEKLMDGEGSDPQLGGDIVDEPDF